MPLLYFQVSDLQPGGLGNTSLTLLGDTAAYPSLCALLNLPPTATHEAAYAALSAFQRSRGLIADGMVGPYHLALLEIVKNGSGGGSSSAAATTSWLTRLSPEALAKMFPFTLRKNLQIYAPYVFAALDAAGYRPNSASGKVMAKVALATIRAETEGFEPISEGRSIYNTAAAQAPFGLYDPPSRIAKNLGNTQVGDGARFKGRGFIQLTGRDNYTRVGAQVNLPLHQLAHLANLPEAAAALLVQYLKNKESDVLAAMAAADLRKARRLVNGGSHGLDRFTDACKRFDEFIAPLLAASPTGAGAGNGTSGRKFSFASFTKSTSNFALPVKSDRVDLRDLPYCPPLGSLPTVFPAPHIVSTFWKDYGALVLDQGQEGACTGFGLACLINYLRFARHLTQHDPAAKKQFDLHAMPPVSPRMLYEFARRYDEFEGADYQGSSCRGALKGWHKHGVCSEADWPYSGLTPANATWMQSALEVSLGVYYRVEKNSIVDLQAAIAEVGAIFVSAGVHSGWDLTPAKPAKLKKRTKAAQPSHETLPVIAFQRGVTKPTGAHAFALVGYNRAGFIVQNSWGPDWGMGGFAVLAYADWQENAMDAWAASLGVPGVVNNAAAIPGTAAAKHGAAAGTSALAGNAAPPDDLGVRHSLVLDQGMPCKTSTGDLLQEQSLGLVGTEWPLVQFRQWQAAHPNETPRLVLYAHGGLNSEDEGLTRAREMAGAFLGNRIYPIFLVWKTGPLETLANRLRGKKPGDPQIAGGFLTDKVSDPFLENTLGPTLGRAAWNDMKRSAAIANTPDGGLTQLANALQSLLIQLPTLEVHLIGHSAGSLLLGPMIANLQRRRLTIKSAHLYAPACTVAFANEHWLPHAGEFSAARAKFPLRVHALTDLREQDDKVIEIYRKSLLYFVARGIEEERPAPLLGMQGAWDRDRVFDAPNGWKGDAKTLQTLGEFDRLRQTIGSSLELSLVSAPRVAQKTSGSGAPDMSHNVPAAHGAFDEDAPLVLETIAKIRAPDSVPQKALDLHRVP